MSKKIMTFAIVMDGRKRDVLWRAGVWKSLKTTHIRTNRSAFGTVPASGLRSKF
jgi:hypothetical protein